MANELTWHDVLAEEKQQPYFLNTLQTVASERQSGVTISVRILITDQDRRMVWHFPFAPALRHHRHC